MPEMIAPTAFGPTVIIQISCPGQASIQNGWSLQRIEVLRKLAKIGAIIEFRAAPFTKNARRLLSAIPNVFLTMTR